MTLLRFVRKLCWAFILSTLCYSCEVYQQGNCHRILLGSDVSTKPNYCILQKNRSLIEQITKENTVYEIKDTFNLSGDTLVIPKNCILKFNGGLLKNGYLFGNETSIVTKRGEIFENICLLGNYNGESYLTWFTQLEDETINLRSLLLFEYCNIDRNVIVRGEGLLCKGNRTIKGHGSTITLKNIESADVFILSDGIIDVSDLTLDCNNNSFSGIVNLLKISTLKNVKINGVSIRNYGSVYGKYEQSSFIGLSVKSVNTNTIDIENCTFSDCIVVGDGIEIEGLGMNYPLNVYCYGSESFGNVTINNCQFNNIYTIDNGGACIVDDGSAIYIQGIRKHGNIKISNCSFNNVSKRAMKLQCNYPIVEDCIVKNNNNIPMDAVIDVQGGGAIINNLVAESNGIIVQCNHGDDLTIRNSTLYSYNSNCITNTGRNLLVDNCRLEGKTIFHGVKEYGDWYYDVNQEGMLKFVSSILINNDISPVSTSIDESNIITFSNCKMENVFISLPFKLELIDSEMDFSKIPSLSYLISGNSITAKHCTINRDIYANKYAFYLSITSAGYSELALNDVTFKSNKDDTWNIVQIQREAKIGVFDVDGINVEVPSNVTTYFLSSNSNNVDIENLVGSIKNYSASGNAYKTNLSK